MAAVDPLVAVVAVVPLVVALVAEVCAPVLSKITGSLYGLLLLAIMLPQLSIHILACDALVEYGLLIRVLF